MLEFISHQRNVNQITMKHCYFLLILTAIMKKIITRVGEDVEKLELSIYW